MIKKILLAVDESELSEKAVHAVCDLAAKGDFEIILLHVLDPVSCLINGETREEVKKELSAKGMVILEKYQKILEASHLKCTLKQTFGVPSAQIIFVAHEESVDMIAVGCHGKGPVVEFLLGSVSKNVLENFKGPVLIVR